MKGMRPYDWFIGIDPGVKGAMAVIHHTGVLDGIIDTPFQDTGKGKKVSNGLDFQGLRDKIRAYANTSDFRHARAIAYVEMINAMGGRGSIATCKLCGSVHAWQMYFALMDVPVVLVPPTVWKRHFGLLTPKGASSREKGQSKLNSRPKAHALYPSADLFRSSDQGSVDRAEAVLIARYGYDTTANK